MLITSRRQFLQAGTAAVLSAVALTPATTGAEVAKPKRRILALGGGGLQGPGRDNLMMKYVISLTGKKNPLICYLPTANADQAGDLSDLEAAAAVEQEMAEQAVGVVIGAAASAEGKGRLKQPALFGRQALFGNLGIGKPLRVGAFGGGHEQSSLKSWQGEF